MCLYKAHSGCTSHTSPRGPSPKPTGDQGPGTQHWGASRPPWEQVLGSEPHGTDALWSRDGHLTRGQKPPPCRALHAGPGVRGEDGLGPCPSERSGVAGLGRLCCGVPALADRVLTFVLACPRPGRSMKRASSLNVLNVGSKAAGDRSQVRSPAPPRPTGPLPGLRRRPAARTSPSAPRPRWPAAAPPGTVGTFVASAFSGTRSVTLRASLTDLLKLKYSDTKTWPVFSL